MYNLLVTAQEGAWDLSAYEYDRTRFGEYTSVLNLEDLRQLSAATIDELISYPALFAYEGTTKPVRVGYIRHIKERGRTILIEYEFEKDIPEIPFDKIRGLRSRLDYVDWEENRTHWAVKEGNLFEILLSAGLIDEKFRNSNGKPGRVDELRFKVAVSFPGEKRNYVKEVVAELKRKLPRHTVFYDQDFTAQLARPNLDSLLQKIYLNNSDLVAVFLSEEYAQKFWCGLEWRALRNIIANKNEHTLMLMRFDNAAVEGLFLTDGYVDLNTCTPRQAAELILERVRLNETYPT